MSASKKLSDPVAFVVVSRKDYEALKKVTLPMEEGSSNFLTGVRIEPSDMWTGPPREIRRSEVEAYRSEAGLADFRSTPVKM